MYRPFKRLRLRFVELDLTQGEVARRAHLAESTLTARMTGRLPWHADEILAVARVLNIPTEQIGAFFFENAPTKKAG